VWGLLVAFFVMAFFGDQVVKIIAEPVEIQLRKWYDRNLGKRADKLLKDQNELPTDQRWFVEFDAEISAADAPKLTGVKSGAEPTAEPTADVAPPVAPDGGIVEKKTEPKAEPRAAAPPMVVKIHAEIGPIVKALVKPLAEVNRPWGLKGLAPQEATVIWFKAVLGASIVAGAPWIFFQLYSFVAVGLYAHERRFVYLTLPFSVGLFLAGVLLCFFLVFPAMLTFFFSVNEWMDIEPEVRLSEWVGFAVVLAIVFGVVFQMPLLMLMLERVGVISYEMLAGQRKIAVLVNFIIAATITPGGDPNTMVLLAIPMCLLFELGLLLMRYFRRSDPFAVGDPSEELAEDLF
ncbi:MAG: twin-arginine translocase subunit TatC, partial [Planctomycetia bacterium]